jgi:hypothetical protein
MTILILRCLVIVVCLWVIFACIGIYRDASKVQKELREVTSNRKVRKYTPPDDSQHISKAHGVTYRKGYHS